VISSLVPISCCTSPAPRNGQAAATFVGDASGVKGGAVGLVVVGALVVGLPRVVGAEEEAGGSAIGVPEHPATQTSSSVAAIDPLSFPIPSI